MIRSSKQAENLSDYSLFSDTLNELPNKQSLLVNTINQYSYCMANEDADFKKSLQMSDVLLPDGIAVVVATRFLTGKKIKKIAGAELHHHILDKLNKEGGSCFYLGASDDTLNKIKNRLAVDFPNVKVGTYSPPFKPVFTAEENDQMINAINDFHPDALFIGMTAPKQEKWAFANKNRINAKIICPIGAVFDFYAGTIKRPSKIMISLGLEWFGRLLHEPKRLWKRYLYFGPIFIASILTQKFKKGYSVIHNAKIFRIENFKNAA